MCHLAGIIGLIAWPICATPSQDGFMRLCVEVFFCHFIEEIILLSVLYNVLWVCNGVLLNNINLFNISMEEWSQELVRMANADGLVLWCQGICCRYPDLYLYRKLSFCRYIEVLLLLLVVWVLGIWSDLGLVKFIIWHFYPHEIYCYHDFMV